eukprot:1816295-Ditylum_brightwellii.AAC.1
MRKHNGPVLLSSTMEGLWELSKDHEMLVKVHDGRAMQYVHPGKETAHQASHSKTYLANRISVNKIQTSQSGRGNDRDTVSVMVLDDPKENRMAEKCMQHKQPRK